MIIIIYLIVVFLGFLLFSYLLLYKKSKSDILRENRKGKISKLLELMEKDRKRMEEIFNKDNLSFEDKQELVSLMENITEKQLEIFEELKEELDNMREKLDSCIFIL